MITELVKKFDESRDSLREIFTKQHPESYEDIVTEVIKAISKDEEYGVPDPERIVRIDHGDYQGTLVFVIAEKGYQPSEYYYVSIGYGSCSVCDTFQSIRYDYDDDHDTPTKSQVDRYMTLALHIIQNLKMMDNIYA